MTPDEAKAFIRANTLVEASVLVPEIRLHVANALLPIWQASEAALARQGIDPPFWAFAWAGGQALARYLLDHPERVQGKRVLNFGAGSGMEALAAAKAGAAAVLAADIDPLACAATQLNAAENGLTVDVTADDLLERPPGEGAWDLVLAGDVYYEQPMASRLEAWLKAWAGLGIPVLVGDPGRSYLPRQGMERVIGYAVKTTREIEDTDLRNAVVWRVLP